MAKTVMIVDDDRNILQSCRRILMDEDYACTVFNSPLKALDALPRVKPAVIISDQRMPEMTGSCFLSQTKRKMPESVRIIMTAYSDMEDVILAINQGHVFRFIKKPWDDQTFKSEIRTAIEYSNLTSKLAEITETKDSHQDRERLQGALELAGAVCHEFAQPLQVISGYCGLLTEKKGLLEDPLHARDCLHIIQQQVDRMGVMLLKIMRIKTYKTKTYIRSTRVVDIEGASSETG